MTRPKREATRKRHAEFVCQRLCGSDVDRLAADAGMSRAAMLRLLNRYGITKWRPRAVLPKYRRLRLDWRDPHSIYVLRPGTRAALGLSEGTPDKGEECNGLNYPMFRRILRGYPFCFGPSDDDHDDDDDDDTPLNAAGVTA